MKFQLMLVDDDIEFANRLCEALANDQREFHIAKTAKEAIGILGNKNIHLALLDEQLPDSTGMELLQKIKQNYPAIINIIITATNSIPLVVKAIQLGAYHYIVKPFKIEELENTVKNALENVELKLKVRDLEDRVISFDKPSFIISSGKMKEIKEQIDAIKNVPFTAILISGETGTGKGSLAKYIHWQYKGNLNDFVHISCADIPANLLESELFGHMRGAFTDAKSDKVGLFEMANGGTLFLDEIDSFPLELQKKLLHFLDTKKIRRVGGTKEIHTELRLITATNANLVELVQQGKFRKDLYYRLNVFHINIPSLRERKESIVTLANYFRELFNITFNKNIGKITDKAIEKLKSHVWHGNVRELKNVIERAMIFCKDNVLKEEDISLSDAETSEPLQFNFPYLEQEIVPLEEVELRYIKHALKIFEDNRTKTARALDISIPTLLSKLKKK